MVNYWLRHWCSFKPALGHPVDIWDCRTGNECGGVWPSDCMTKNFLWKSLVWRRLYKTSLVWRRRLYKSRVVSLYKPSLVWRMLGLRTQSYSRRMKSTSRHIHSPLNLSISISLFHKYPERSKRQGILTRWCIMHDPECHKELAFGIPCHGKYHMMSETVYLSNVFNWRMPPHLYTPKGPVKLLS